MVLESNSRKQLTQIRAEEWMVPGSHLGKDLSLRIYGEWGMEKGCWGRGSSEEALYIFFCNDTKIVTKRWSKEQAESPGGLRGFDEHKPYN